MLLNEKLEPTTIDGGQHAIGLGTSVGAARSVVNQGKLAKDLITA